MLARRGWDSDFPNFRTTHFRIIRIRLQDFITDASAQQVQAWDDSIPKLQHEVGEILDLDATATEFATILEYELPLESRRPDAVLLLNGAVVVVEFKGKELPSQADIDQVAAYARDLRCYHRECSARPVYPVLVPIRAKGTGRITNGVTIIGPDAVDQHIMNLSRDRNDPPISPKSFLAEDAYRPLPTIVQAARELMQSGKIRAIHRAKAATEPAIRDITRIIYEAARTKTRRLIFLTGVPGAGKTLVGLQIAHAHFLDDLAAPRSDGSIPTAPAVFLSGNGPLVSVLQYELRSAGGGGRTFVRGVFDYVKRYSRSQRTIPPEHVLIFDEAQRAFDMEAVAEKHRELTNIFARKSEPELFVEFAERVPEWCVVIGLIGGGQEIHTGEEAGVAQWKKAIEGSRNSTHWKVHFPEPLFSIFNGAAFVCEMNKELNLDVQIRFHSAEHLHEFVAGLLKETEDFEAGKLAETLESEAYHLRLTRDLSVAKQYLRDRYGDAKEKRFGLIASSRDKSLQRFGVDNSYQATRNTDNHIGQWYGDDEDSTGGFSCRHLRTVVTEFGAQGLELDASLLAWGTDFILENGKWSNRLASRYKNPARVKDPFALRRNAYRVLLTRGRDATVVFVPPMSLLDETYHYLAKSGFIVI